MLVLLIGPSGAGKSTIETELVKHGIERLKSHTTREKRPAEPEDAYYFVSEEDFKSTPMLESAEYAGNLYGLSVEEVRKTDNDKRNFVAVVEWHGAQQLKKLCTCRVVTVFIDSLLVQLEARLKTRGTSDVTQRLEKVQEDRKNACNCDYQFVNADGQLNFTVAQVLKLYSLQGCGV